MKIAAVQMLSTPDLRQNLARAVDLVAQAAAAGAELVALPEYFCLMGRRDADKLDIAEPPGQGPIQQMLAETARRHGVWLVGGTLPLRIANANGWIADRALNTSLVFAPDGSLEIAIQHEKPSAPEVNWLPSPAGEFHLVLRTYQPKEELRSGRYSLPPLEIA